ncbi:MAG TPA: ABC transporter ATP-binding protein [Pseudobdellovibrionaceae bacterium]|nr:ABC transporter ATP-binding protein [Pseudobdellovibrionaceae bacterium]
MKPAHLEMIHVRKHFGQVKAIDDVNFNVYPGEIVALLGSNGAGKTTLIGLTSGALHPSAGEVKVFGMHPTDRLAHIYRRVLPQELSFPKTLTVNEVLKVIYSHFPGSDFEDLLQRVGLDHIRNRSTGALSGGERRKLALIGSLAGDPKLVLLDEPTANVDLVGQNNIHMLLKEYFSGQSSSLIFSSHQMKEVEDLATRVIVIATGRIVFDGSVEKLKKLRPEKKVRFRTPDLNFKITSATETKLSEDGRVECLGRDSDEMLREIIERKGIHASQFEILDPSLDEAILSLCKVSSKEVRP